jgi:hypothetical protein
MVAPICSLLERWGNTLVKDNGSAWLRWLLKQGGVILAHPNHRDNRCVFPLLDRIILHPSKEHRSLLTSQREKQEENPMVLLLPSLLQCVLFTIPSLLASLICGPQFCPALAS